MAAGEPAKLIRIFLRDSLARARKRSASALMPSTETMRMIISQVGIFLPLSTCERYAAETPISAEAVISDFLAAFLASLIALPNLFNFLVPLCHL